MIQNSSNAGITHVLLPNIDSTSWQPMLDLKAKYPAICYPMAGLHPTSVLPETVESELAEVTRQLENGSYIAVGEIGIDLYWDRTHQALQEEAFLYQVKLAKKHKLPVAIHVRKSFDEVWRILKPETGPDLKGVFHCFPGDENQARRAIEAGFMLGIGGVVTFKNSHLQNVVAAVGPDHIVLETDAPFLAPAPHRGKRNEPAYVAHTARAMATVFGLGVEEFAARTTANFDRLFSRAAPARQAA